MASWTAVWSVNNIAQIICLPQFAAQIGLLRPYVHTLVTTQLPSHVSLSDLLNEFGSLTSLQLRYG